ncbi:tyrosine-type recombinase/integrase [Paraburkholderia terrae]|uniref:tyrosine-type recombinase/integrase n=1 Tax=Paraburkholderia terrae TaxID=311230 RepID=UPI00296AF8C1|nr:tyrosine-type recombinase/integrase [Paraburkholderia terrae]MDW3660385.1 tyrosine-type recombinase/integrase [Paraburkholderia terrae]
MDRPASVTDKVTGARLSRSNMRKLAPGGKITERGITFERQPNGDGVFTVNVMIDGLRIHRVVGRESDGTTRTQVEEFIAKLRSDAKYDRLSLPKGRKIALSFRDAASKYLEKLELEGGKDLKMKRMRLARHLVPFFADTPLSKISTFDIERYKKQRAQEKSARGGDRVSDKAKGQGVKAADKAQNATPGTINRELAVLSHLLSKAIEWGWITHRPAKLSRLKEGDGRIVYLTVEQVAKFIEAAKASDNPQLYPFVVIAVETSMRMSEILSIRRENVDVQRRVIYIPKAKAGRREQPIPAHLATFLKGCIEALPPGTPWLFPSAAAKSGHAVDIRKPFIKAVRNAGLDPALVVRHTLRHTAITHLVQAGIDLPTVKRISGHKTLAMVERYAHQNGEHIQEAMDTLQSRLKLV